MVSIRSYYKGIDCYRQRFYDKSNDLLFYHKRVLAGFIDCKGNNILDVGCGCAPITSMAASHNKVIGVDLSESALHEASRNNIDCVAGNIEEQFPFADKTFDYVVLTEVIEHIFDPVFLLKEIHRVLKDKGIIICSVPNTSFILNRLFFLFTGLLNDCTAQDRLLDNIPYISEHIRIIPPKLLKRLLINSDFIILKTDYWFPDRFVKMPFRKISFLAGVIKSMGLHKLFPNLFSLNTCIKAKKGA